MTEKFDTAAQKITPRDAQKGGQGALSAAHPETPLKQDALPTDSAANTGQMSAELSDAQIDLLCALEERDVSKFAECDKQDLERLLSGGYAAPSEGPLGLPCKVTAKGTDFLAKRGASLNQS